jgi:hypothetical protein
MERRDRIAEPWGARTPYGAGEPWPVRVDTYLAEGVAKKDAELLSVAKHCHPETLRQACWANTKLKESSPQIMAS